MGHLFSDKTRLLTITLLLTAVLLSYFNAVSNGFVYDDVAMVQVNPIIRGWENIPAIFSSGYWTPTGQSSGGLYRPLTILSYMVEYSVAGLDTRLYHLDNVILHFLCSVLVYLLVLKITGSQTGSAAAALLFAVHTVHVEAVANVSGRSELLASFFTLAGLYAFICARSMAMWGIVSAIALFLGLLSKESAIVLPALALTYLLVFEREGRGSKPGEIARSLAPFALAIAVFIVIRLIVLADDIYPQGTGQVLVYTKGFWRMLVMFKVFVKYVLLALFPVDLHSHYMLRPPDSLLDPWVAAFFVIVGSAAAVFYRLIMRKDWGYFFFVLWFFIALIPVSNIIPIGILMAERSMYLPSVAVCAIGGLLFYGAAGGYGASGRPRSIVAASLFLAVLVSLGLLTHSRNMVWRNADTLDDDLIRSYDKILSDFPESGRYYYHLFKTIKSRGDTDRALAAIEKAAELDPEDVVYRIELAKYHLALGNFAPALAEVQKTLSLATELDPDVYAMFAEVFDKNGMSAERDRFISMALKDDPGRYHVDIAEIAARLYNMGMFEDAERYLKRAIELNPYMPKYHLHYSDLLIKTGREKESFDEFRRAEALGPVGPEAYFVRGVLFAQQDRYAEAVGLLEKAVKLRPADPTYHYYLAAACIGAGLDERAVSELKEAVRLKPDYAEARRLLEMR